MVLNTSNNFNDSRNNQKRKIRQHAFYRDSGNLKVKKIELNRNFTLSPLDSPKGMSIQL